MGLKFSKMERPGISDQGKKSYKIIVLIATLFLTISFVFGASVFIHQFDSGQPATDSSHYQSTPGVVKSATSSAPVNYDQVQRQSSLGLNAILNAKNIQSPYVTIAAGTGIHTDIAGFYTVTLSETNLPSGANWYGGLLSVSDIFSFEVNFAIPITNHTTSTSMTFQVPNGTYYLFAGRGNPDILFQTFSVSGASVSLTVNFPTLYKVTLTEKGIPSGAKWSYILEGILNTYTVLTLNSSTTTTSIAYLPDGYYYTINGRNVPSVQSYTPIIVNGAPVAYTVQIPTLYKTTFTQSSFSSGTQWGLDIYNYNGSVSYSNYSTTNSMVAYIPNGTYYVSGGPGYSFLTFNKISVSGSSQTVSLSFPHFYKVTFIGSGVVSGDFWTLNIQNCNSTTGIGSLSVNAYLTGTTAIAYMPNGTYQWSATEQGAVVQGGFRITGQNILEHFNFGKLYKVTFTATNHPAGQYWEVEIAPALSSYTYFLNSSMSSNIFFYLPNGTYSYLIYVRDYTTQAVTIVVNGAAKSVSVALPSQYAITFTESGLHSGMSWSIQAYDTNYSLFAFNSTSGTSMIVYSPDLTFTYYITEGNTKGALSETIVGAQGNYTVSGSSGSVAVNFPKLYSVTFNVLNLAASYSAQAAVSNGTQYVYTYTNSTTSGPIVSFLPNGNYNYTITEFKTVTNATNVPYNSVLTISVVTKEFNVTGAPLSFSVHLQTLYKFTASVSGLSAGEMWVAAVTSTNFTVYGANYPGTGSQSFMIPNGSYYVSYFYVKKTEVFSAELTFTVNGGQASSSYAFPTTYEVTFAQGYTGPCDSWGVSISNYTLVTYSYGFGNSIIFSLPNGTYSYTAEYNFSNSHGTFTVSGAKKTVNVVIHGFYQISVSESGLPSGTDWYLNLTGPSYFSGELTSNSVTFYLQNGSYYFAPEATGILYEAAGQAVNVAGASVTVSITFQVAHTYKVSFVESGLPSGTKWSLNVTGLSSGSSSTTSTIAVNLPNGTFAFTISNTSAYYASPHSGSVTVSGKDTSVSVTFQHFAYISGSVTPSSAKVTINGKQISLSSGAFNVSVPAGTYYFVANLSGYKNYYSNFTLTAGHSKEIKVTLQSLSSPSVPTLFGINEYYLIGGIVVLIVVIGALVAVRRRK